MCNITFSNINVKCNRVGDIQGNPADKISDILFRNVTLVAVTAVLKTKDYPNVRVENVIVNGVPFVIK